MPPFIILLPSTILLLLTTRRPLTIRHPTTHRPIIPRPITHLPTSHTTFHPHPGPSTQPPATSALRLHTIAGGL